MMGYSAGMSTLLRMTGLVLAAALLTASQSFAGQDLVVRFRTSAEPGSAQGPALLITSHKDVTRLVVNLERIAPDGSREGVTLRPSLRTGRETEVLLPHPTGRFAWEGSMYVLFADGSEGDMPLRFETSRIGQITFTVDGVSREDVMARRVVIKADRPAARAEVEVQGDGGRHLGRSEIDLGGAPAGSDLVISWDQQVEGDPLLVILRLYCTEGSWRGIRWTPWQVSIPHDTVEFDTGQSSIRPDQAPKLQSVLGEMRRQISRYEGLTDVEVSLWIVGHTDTVGSKEHNMRLSEARARAIATWFRRAGIRGTIHYRGMGQEALLVATPDNIDEPRNRRAEYVVSATDPYGERQLPGRWRRLP